VATYCTSVEHDSDGSGQRLAKVRATGQFIVDAMRPYRTPASEVLIERLNKVLALCLSLAAFLEEEEENRIYP
jgi:hypothetical protein